MVVRVCFYCQTPTHREEANFCGRCGFPVRKLAEIPSEFVEMFKMERPLQYALAVAQFGGMNDGC